MLQTALSHEHLVLSSEEHALPRPLPSKPAHRIQSESEAIGIAVALAGHFAVGAASRDSERHLPYDLIDTFSQSGLWGVTVPRAYGGADLSHGAVAEIFAIIAEADPSLAQIPQNHFNDIDTIRWTGSDAQKRFFFGEALYGVRFGNAFAEPTNSADGAAFQTRLTAHKGSLVLRGRKFYSTGALLAHWVQVGAVDDDGNTVLAFVRRDAEGLTVVDDWSGFGQRTTASGTVILDDVIVAPQNILPAYKAFAEPTTNGSLSQLIHSAIDLGIARAAVRETIRFVSSSSRPWADAHVERASDDPLTIVEVGNIEYRLHGAEALMERAAHYVDVAAADPNNDSVAEASIAVAEAKIATTEIALLAANKLFELSGAKSTLAKYALDRHWRNARTHTLHDPVRWKYHAVGNYYLNGIRPARHGWI